MKSYRLNRLFNPQSNRCFNVAVDHGFFNEPGFLNGIEKIESAIETLVMAGPDAIQLTIGQARHLQALRTAHKPSLVLRIDMANIYGRSLPDAPFSLMLEHAALQAVQQNATCVCVNLFQIPGAHDVHRQCVQNIMRLKRECDLYAMPMMVEPLVFRPNSEVGGYMVDGDLTKILHLVRQAVELGADVIKADPTDDVSIYHRVVEAAGGIPVLVRGGGKVSDREIVERTSALLRQGISGFVYGRNVIQHQSPRRITQAMLALLHGEATVEQALAILE